MKNRVVDFRVPDVLYSDFSNAVKKRDESMSQALRKFMRNYVEYVEGP